MYAREIVDETFRLKAQGLTDKEIAARCGVSLRALRHWRYGTRRGPEVEARRADRTTYCPRCSTGPLHEEAYSYLLGAYLGDGHITENKNRPGVHTLWILYDKKYPQLIAYCRAAIEAVFPVKVFMADRPGCTAIKAASKHWPCVFPQHGPGKKHDRPILLEPWQRRIVDEHPQALVRGLIHSDGCRVINRIRKASSGAEAEYHEYPRYHFTNASTDIIDILTHALDRLDIAWKIHVNKRMPRYRDAHIVSISRRNAVARLDDFVGPKY
ncbi:LAGLIDADG family homing endonuclease [Nocardiopsis alba]|uniref:LAGLIDADG family homing endonuclease n=1 Tax=Nocardiopsis alba TaxID=53437 RepID=UPI0033EEA8FA